MLTDVGKYVIGTSQTALGQRKLTRNGAELVGSQLNLLNLLEVHIFQNDLYRGVGQQDGTIVFMHKLENPFEMDGLRGTIERTVGEEVADDSIFRLRTLAVPPIITI